MDPRSRSPLRLAALALASACAACAGLGAPGAGGRAELAAAEPAPADLPAPLAPAAAAAAPSAPAPVADLCEDDFDRDGVADLVLIVRRRASAEVVLLLRREGGFRGVVLAKGAALGWRVHCARGGDEGTARAERRPRLGAGVPYVVVRQPDGGTSAFAWNGSTVGEVLLEDLRASR